MAPTISFNETRFSALISQWNQHQTLKRSGASVSDLAASRARLDATRFGTSSR